MTKTQKIWLGIFLAMFIVPEVLWSPVANDIYEYSQSGIVGTTYSFRHTFLQKTDYQNVLSVIFFIQFIGLLSAFIYLIIIRKSIKSGLVFWIGLTLLLLLAIVTFLLFGLSISLRHIGF